VRVEDDRYEHSRISIKIPTVRARAYLRGGFQTVPRSLVIQRGAHQYLDYWRKVIASSGGHRRADLVETVDSHLSCTYSTFFPEELLKKISLASVIVTMRNLRSP
jgi:hypothetical protein